MSYGITPADFVQQVYYAQEKVILNFKPDDDKYKEVLMEANLVLQELQNSEDWLWLRERLELGSTDHQCGEMIPEYELPEWVYKLSTLHDDCVRLYAKCGRCCDMLNENDFIEVPIVSAGELNHRSMVSYDGYSRVQQPDYRLKAAVVHGNVLTFNRPLTVCEQGRIVVADVQRRIEQIHICTPNCERDENGKCLEIEDRILTQVPDPNYVIIKTAANHAEGSPPAQGRIAGLNDQAMKLLSAMRQNDASATDSDYLEWAAPGNVWTI